MLMLKILNKGGRPPKLDEGMVWEILRLKSEYGINTWKQSFKLAKEMYPAWNMPSYRVALSSIYKLFEALYWLIQFTLRLSRASFLKKNKFCFVDSSPIPVCRLHKSRSSKLCKEYADYGKNSMGYYYGVKMQSPILMDLFCNME